MDPVSSQLLEMLYVIWGRISYLAGVPVQQFGEWAWRHTSYYLLSPEISLLVGLGIICLIEIFSKRDNFLVVCWVAIISLLGNLMMTIHMMYYTSRYFGYGLGTWWGGLETIDPYALMFKQLMDWGDIMIILALIGYKPLRKYRVEFIMLMLAGHVHGWPFPKGGAGKITDALVACFKQFGGRIQCGWRVESLDELPKAKAYLFDTSPSALANIAGNRLPQSYRDRLLRYRHGPGIFKVDYALSEPVPWTNDTCRRAGTVHVGGTLDEIVISEREAWDGIHAERPFVLAAQQSVFDPSRAPEGKHTFWAYCHVPSGSTVDMTDAIERQIERFAPGFRDCVLARHTMTCADFERYNPNLIGGDVVGGVADWTQLFTRPVARWNPYTTPAKDIFICSASTPPGAGVHGMCGMAAASSVVGNR